MCDNGMIIAFPLHSYGHLYQKTEVRRQKPDEFPPGVSLRSLTCGENNCWSSFLIILFSLFVVPSSHAGLYEEYESN